MLGTFSPPPRVSDPDIHHGTCVTHVPWCMPGSLTSGFLWSRWRGKRSRHSRRMRNPQFYVSGKRPMAGRALFGRIPSKYNSILTTKIREDSAGGQLKSTQIFRPLLHVLKEFGCANIKFMACMKSPECDHISMDQSLKTYFSKRSICESI